MAAYRRVYDYFTCRLTAKNRDQLGNPTLGNGVWATFTFFYYYIMLRIVKSRQLQMDRRDVLHNDRRVGGSTNINAIAECRLFFNFMLGLPGEKIEKRRISFESKVLNCNSLLYYFNICSKLC